MGKAHFAAVLTGIETANVRLLNNARKGTTPEQVRRAIELLHAHDIGVWGTFTLGLPGESPADTAASAESIPSAGVDVLQITVATPIPGSDLYARAQAEGQLTEPDWDRFDFTTPLMPGQLPKAEMDALIHKAYLKVYLRPRFLLSLLSKRTNIQRLRRTALRVFFSWLWFLVKERLSPRNWSSQGRSKRAAGKPASADASQAEKRPRGSRAAT
jgi:radical SAM superfamily enzyme YgiQ (UPF0313 family)